MNYWMLSLSPDNFAVTREMGFTVQGFSQRQRRKADRMVRGDRLLFYVKDMRVFPATTTVDSTMFEDDSPLWTTSQPNEPFKYRVRLKPECVLPEESYLRGLQIGPRLEYVRRWPPELWPFALLDELHLLPRRDFEFIEEEMRKLLGRGGERPLWMDGGRQRGSGPRRGGRGRREPAVRQS